MIYHTCIYNRLDEDALSVSIHVQDIKKLQIFLLKRCILVVKSYKDSVTKQLFHTVQDIMWSKPKPVTAVRQDSFPVHVQATRSPYPDVRAAMFAA